MRDSTKQDGGRGKKIWKPVSLWLLKKLRRQAAFLPYHSSEKPAAKPANAFVNDFAVEKLPHITAVYCLSAIDCD
jgi:hypothetical protein